MHTIIIAQMLSTGGMGAIQCTYENKASHTARFATGVQFAAILCTTTKSDVVAPPDEYVGNL